MMEGLRRFLRFKTIEDELEVRQLNWGDDDANGWFIVYPDGEAYAGPYARESDAKGQLTRIKNGYTPGSRRLRGDIR